ETARIVAVVKAKLDEVPSVVPHDAFDRRSVSSNVELIILELSTNIDHSLALVEKARQLTRGTLIAVGPASDPKFILRTLQAGADNFVDIAAIEVDLDSVIARLGSKDDAPTSGAFISLLGASGGSGTSTTAVSIAAVIAQKCSKCALIDLKPGRGDL